jgi:multiple antibiotic resistance protein
MVWERLYPFKALGAPVQLSDVINYYVSLFVVCSPLSALPALLNLTLGKTVEEKKKIAIRASFAVAIILVIVTWIGLPFLNIFGIRIPAFQVAGGFVLLLVALSMLNAQPSRIQQTDEDRAEAVHKISIAIVPLAMPIMAGPGAITTVIVGASIWPGVLNHFFLSICAIFVALTTGSVLYFASHLERVLKHTGINLITRIGGLILASMAVQSMASGLHGLWLIYRV